jgi:hypothetical protein
VADRWPPRGSRRRAPRRLPLQPGLRHAADVRFDRLLAPRRLGLGEQRARELHPVPEPEQAFQPLEVGRFEPRRPESLEQLAARVPRPRRRHRGLEEAAQDRGELERVLAEALLLRELLRPEREQRAQRLGRRVESRPR